MTEACNRTAVEAIHSSPYQTVLYLAGGASQILGLLLSVPGASNTVLEAVVPYSRMSLIQLLAKVLSFSIFNFIIIKPTFTCVFIIHCFCSYRFHCNFVVNRLLTIWLYWLITVLLSSPLQVASLILIKIAYFYNLL